MFVLAKEQRELLIFRLDFCSDYVLLALEFQIKIHIVSSLSQEVLLKEPPFFLSAFKPTGVILTNSFSIGHANAGKELECSKASSGTGSYKTAPITLPGFNTHYTRWW